MDPKIKCGRELRQQSGLTAVVKVREGRGALEPVLLSIAGLPNEQISYCIWLIKFNCCCKEFKGNSDVCKFYIARK